MPKHGLSKQIVDGLIEEKTEFVRTLYENGCHLDEICRQTRLDIDTTLETIRKFRYKKNELYLIYEYQEDKKISKKVRIEIRRHLMDKFFPVGQENEFFSASYHLYWKEKMKKQERLKKGCSHSICHIACSLCGKILADASETYKKIKDQLS